MFGLVEIVPVSCFRPVDSERLSFQLGSVKKKPLAVGEAAAPYNAKPAVKGKAVCKEETAGQGKTSDAAFKKVTDKIFSERKELLHKLAQ